MTRATFTPRTARRPHRTRVGDGEGALVEGPAHDRPGQGRPPAASAASAAQVVEGADAAGGDHRDWRWRPAPRPGRARSGPSSVPSRLISVTTSAATPASREGRGQLQQVAARTPPASPARPRRGPGRPGPPPPGGGPPGAAPGRGPPAPRCPAPPGPRRRRTGRRPRPRRGRRPRSAPARRPPPRWRPPRPGCAGSPVRAASRSTTWIHGAPSACEGQRPGPPGRRRRRSPGRSRPGRAARSGRPAGRWRDRAPSRPLPLPRGPPRRTGHEVRRASARPRPPTSRGGTAWP